MTSRDFIRQVLEFDRASDSESGSEDFVSENSDNELQEAIEKSLEGPVNDESDDSQGNTGVSDDEDEASMDETISEHSRNETEFESFVGDSNMSFPSGVMTAEQIVQSVYAPMPEFIPDDMPALPLPVSSNDLLIERKHVLRAAGIYEILRLYKQIVRLSPFIFEDFVASLVSTEHNVLLHEIHSCLIRTLLREEDNNQTSFGPSDLKDSMNSLFYFNDAMTYPHVMLEYLRSDDISEFKMALEAVSDAEYPIVSLEKKLTVLEVLCNLFLTTNSLREDLSSDGFIKYDDHCRTCQKCVERTITLKCCAGDGMFLVINYVERCRTGDVLCCDGCCGVYHLYCVDPPMDELPEGEWYCSVCVDNEVTVSCTIYQSQSRCIFAQTSYLKS